MDTVRLTELALTNYEKCARLDAKHPCIHHAGGDGPDPFRNAVRLCVCCFSTYYTHDGNPAVSRNHIYNCDGSFNAR